MKLKKAYPFAYFGALVLMPVYLFIAVTHLYFSPRFWGDLNNDLHTGFKKNTEVIYYLIRNDRSVLNESKPAKSFPKNKRAFVASLLNNVSRSPIKTGDSNGCFCLLPPKYHSYLSNHVIRI
jgi:hypothetical protein